MNKKELIKEMERITEVSKEKVFDGDIKGCLILIRENKPTQIEIY